MAASSDDTRSTASGVTDTTVVSAVPRRPRALNLATCRPSHGRNRTATAILAHAARSESRLSASAPRSRSPVAGAPSSANCSTSSTIARYV